MPLPLLHVSPHRPARFPVHQRRQQISPPLIASAPAGSLAAPSVGALQCCFPAWSAAHCRHAAALGVCHSGDVGRCDGAGRTRPRDRHAGPQRPAGHGTAAPVQPVYAAGRGRRVRCRGPVRLLGRRACLSPARPPPLVCGCGKTRCG